MFTPENTVLLVVDIQGKLATQVHDHSKLLKNIQGMIKGAQILDIPILWTEQAPEKIGPTIPEIASLLSSLKLSPITKVSFSCCGSNTFMEELKFLNRKQILLVGIETHVCVYQTAVDLIEAGYEVQVIADCVSSRTLENKNLGIDRMQARGAGITSLEMIACELIRTSQHFQFKDILSLIK